MIERNEGINYTKKPGRQTMEKKGREIYRSDKRMNAPC
jgi:hypothetical protein